MPPVGRPETSRGCVRIEEQGLDAAATPLSEYSESLKRDDPCRDDGPSSRPSRRRHHPGRLHPRSCLPLPDPRSSGHHGLDPEGPRRDRRVVPRAHWARRFRCRSSEERSRNTDAHGNGGNNTRSRSDQSSAIRSAVHCERSLDEPNLDRLATERDRRRVHRPDRRTSASRRRRPLDRAYPRSRAQEERTGTTARVQKCRSAGNDLRANVDNPGGRHARMGPLQRQSDEQGKAHIS